MDFLSSLKETGKIFMVALVVISTSRLATRCSKTTSLQIPKFRQLVALERTLVMADLEA